jgi:hypothetical protein
MRLFIWLAAYAEEGDSMSITVVIVTTALASTAGASLVSFLIQRYYDRRLEYYFNSRLEELKSALSFQEDIKSQIISKRFEIYPSITELIYRLRNQLKGMRKRDQLSLEQAVEFLRLAEQYTEKIYSARLYLERDGIFESLHNYKSHILTAKNLLLDWIYLTREALAENENQLETVLANLNEVYNHLDRQHRRLIRNLTQLTKG